MKYPLSKLSGYHPLSPEFIADLGNRIRRLEVKKGNTIHLRGNRCHDLWLIETGMLACYDYDPDGIKSYCSWLMREGDFVTAVESFNMQDISSESIIALSDCILWALSKEDLEHLTEKYPEFRNIRLKLTDLYHIQSRVMDIKRKRPSEEFYAFLLSACPEIVKEAPATHLASFMGISRSRLYKIIELYSK